MTGLHLASGHEQQMCQVTAKAFLDLSVLDQTPGELHQVKSIVTSGLNSRCVVSFLQLIHRAHSSLSLSSIMWVLILLLPNQSCPCPFLLRTPPCNTHALTAAAPMCAHQHLHTTMCSLWLRLCLDSPP
jgi:hypothetical protein